MLYKIKDGSTTTPERRFLKEKMNEILSKNPKIKYIFDNIKEINKQLGDKITKKGDCP